MAELKLSDLPLMTEDDFTENDRFVMVDNGNARAMTKPVFVSWLGKNVSGEQGVQGFTGRDGTNGLNGKDGTNGVDGQSAYQIAVSQGFVGTLPQYVTSLKGVKGDSGLDGSDGWSPRLSLALRGNDVVIQLTDWIGGEGDKPTLLGYLGESGIVTNIANALNIKGNEGIQGIRGIQGLTGADGLDGKTVQSVTFNANQSLTFTYTDATTVTTNTPNIKQGWGTYKDSQYTDTSTLNIPINTEQVLPNNANTKIETLPSNYPTFYQAVANKYILSDTQGFYSVRVRFKVTPSEIPSTINLSMSKATTDVPFSEDKVLRGDNKIQEMSFNTTIYGDAALGTNGLTIRVKTFDRAVNIYNIEVTVAKLI